MRLKDRTLWMVVSGAVTLGGFIWWWAKSRTLDDLDPSWFDNSSTIDDNGYLPTPVDGSTTLRYPVDTSAGHCIGQRWGYIKSGGRKATSITAAGTRRHAGVDIGERRETMYTPRILGSLSMLVLDMGIIWARVMPSMENIMEI